MKTTTITKVLLSAGLLGALAACSQEDDVCSLICECEHCSDPQEDATCTYYATYSDVAEAYDCADDWSELLTCVEDQGTCDEDEADFSISTPGVCGSVQIVGGSCTAPSDCAMPNAVCEANQCGYRVCDGSSMPCTTNEDCDGTGNLCEEEMRGLAECIAAASDHEGDVYYFSLPGLGGSIVEQ